MAQVTLSLQENAFIDGNSPTANAGGIQIDIGEIDGGLERRRSLVQFDVSSIPSNATVTSATLRLYKDASDLSANDRTFRVYRVRRNWAQAQVTWNVYTTGNSWTTAGCGDTTNDREGTEIGSLAMPNVTSAGYKEITLTPSAVEDWIDGTFTNNGMILIMDTETNDMNRFDGPISGYANPPELIIDYDLPSGSGFYYMSV